MSKSIHMSTTTTNKKRAPNAYNIYCQDEQLRSSIKKENPDWASSEVMKELGKRWQQLSDQDKKPFEELAKKGKEEFLENQDTSNMEQVLKRPKSSYMHYSNNKEVRDQIRSEHPEWKVTEIASELGKRWNSMSDKEKKVWEDLAQKEKESLLADPVYQWRKKKSPKKDSSLEARVEHLEKIVLELQHTIQELKSNQEEEVE